MERIGKKSCRGIRTGSGLSGAVAQACYHEGVVPSTAAAPLRIPIATLAPDPKNPRRMPDESAAGLAISLETFGALDIVFNDTTGELVSGHQRVAQLKAAGAAEVVRDGDWGHIVHPKTGERFPVRFVKWDATKQSMANLVANNPHLQGDFTEGVIGQARALEDEAHFLELQLDKLVAEEEKKLGSEGDGEGAEDQSAAIRENFQIVITCVDESEQSTLLQRFMDEGLKCRALI